jgi:hypothetical protein
LAESYIRNEQFKEAMEAYKKILEGRDGLFKESFLSFTLTEKFRFYYTVGEVFEKNGILFEAV